MRLARRIGDRSLSNIEILCRQDCFVCCGTGKKTTDWRDGPPVEVICNTCLGVGKVEEWVAAEEVTLAGSVDGVYTSRFLAYVIKVESVL